MEGFEVHTLPHPVNFRVLELVRKMSVSQKQVVEVSAAQLWSWPFPANLRYMAWRSFPRGSSEY